MEDELDLSLDGKNLGNLRVVDLKQQLEKRGLSKSGSKKDLVKRLKLQLEFEKLGEERKLGTGGDLKLELDAATEQNEFVRQYLARQQKLLAEQNTSDHSSESEEIQNSDDEQCDSPHVQKSNEIISEKCISKSGGSEDLTCATENQKLANLEEDTDNIACKTDKRGENLVDKMDTSGIIMPSSKDLSTSNMLCDPNQTLMEQADCSSVPYSLSDIQLPESPKKESIKSNSDKESRKLVADIEAVKIVVLKESTKLAEEKETKSVPKKESRKSVSEKESGKSVSEKDLSKSVSEKELSKSVSEKESSKSVSEKESPKSVSEKESPKSVSEKESSKYVSEKGSIKSIAKKELTKSVTEKESTKSISETQHVTNEHETNTKSDQMNTNGLQVSTNSTVTKPSSLSKSKDSTHSLKADDSNQNIKSSKNNQNSNEKQLEEVFKSRSYSNDEKDSTSEENESKILEHKTSSKKSSRKPESSKKVSKEISKKRKNKIASEESTNESSSDSGEYRSDVETKMSKTSPTREVKRRHSKNESSSESNVSESSDISPKRLSKIPIKKPKIDNVEKTDEIRKKYPVDTSQDTGDKTIVGDKITKDVSSCRTKQKLKIKRDNIVLEEHISSKQESSTEKHVLQAEKRSDASENKNAHHDLQSVQPKDAEITEEIPKPYVSRKVTLSNRKHSRSSVEEKEESTHKKSKWGSFATAQKNSKNISISTTSLKSWFPDFKLINEPVPANEAISAEQISTHNEEKFINEMSGNEGGTHKQTSYSMDPIEQDMQSPMEEEPVEQGPVSKIIFIQNLVRPFTLSQLKDLLKQHGNFIEGQFWIDKIKSKCIVVYETEEAAVKAKNALNNSRWPPSNPKILTVQYINEEEIEFLKKGSEPPKTIPEPPVEAIECYDVKSTSPIEESRRKDREHKREKEKTRPQAPLREWDKDKIVQDSPERVRFVNKENEKIKAVEKKERKESKRRPNDDTPAKLLDDLFQKTKSSPCIYWLPLTEEQIKERAEEKRLKRLENEKRTLKEQESGDRKNKIIRSGHRSRDRELQRSSSRSRSPVSRRR